MVSEGEDEEDDREEENYCCDLCDSLGKKQEVMRNALHNFMMRCHEK